MSPFNEVVRRLNSGKSVQVVGFTTKWEADGKLYSSYPLAYNASFDATAKGEAIPEPVRAPNVRAAFRAAVEREYNKDKGEAGSFVSMHQLGESFILSLA